MTNTTQHAERPQIPDEWLHAVEVLRANARLPDGPIQHTGIYDNPSTRMAIATLLSDPSGAGMSDWWCGPSLLEGLHEAVYILRELSGSITEYRELPCKSLETRLFGTLDRYQKRMNALREQSDRAAEQPDDTWTSSQVRLPTAADADFSGNVIWWENPYEDLRESGWRPVVGSWNPEEWEGAFFEDVSEIIPYHPYWMPTGLKRPEPPRAPAGDEQQ